MEALQRQPEHATTDLTIEARDLDTDARRRTTMHVIPPADPSGQRAALVEAVERLFPAAKLRSFSDGAASFLDAEHLIVASYADVPARRKRGAETSSAAPQDALFAA
jgi:hypothetical protein